MMSRKMNKPLIITAVFLIAGATLAFAQGGRGRGYMMNDRGDGYGMGRGGSGYLAENCPYFGGYGADLTDEQIAKLDASRDKFFAETDTLRKDIRDKRIALNDALNADTPNKDDVVKLQKDLSQLESQFDELAVQHRLEMRTLLPEGAYKGGYGPGAGRGFGRGMYRGFKGGGDCCR